LNPSHKGATAGHGTQNHRFAGSTTVIALRAAGRASVADVVLQQQVGAFDQFDAYLVGEEGMLAIGNVVDTLREQHHFGFTRAGRRGHRTQRSDRRCNRQPTTRPTRAAVVQHQPLGNVPGLDDLAIVIDIVDERSLRPHALLERIRRLHLIGPPHFIERMQ
jgi:hypothetical protein